MGGRSPFSAGLLLFVTPLAMHVNDVKVGKNSMTASIMPWMWCGDEKIASLYNGNLEQSKKMHEKKVVMKPPV